MSWALPNHFRQVLEREQGGWSHNVGGRLNTVLLYPNTYAVGMANLGLQTVYRILNQRPDALCQRAFLPDSQTRPLYAKTGEPLLALESARPVAEADLVLATLSFENDAPNLAAMLEHAGLGQNAAGRSGPLVVAGGVAAMLNPEPYAEMVDAFLLGEAEVVLDPFVDALLAHPGLERDALLLKLAQNVPGFYVPRFYQPEYGPDGILTAFEPLAEVPRTIAAPKYTGPASGLAKSVITAPDSEFGDMSLIEVGRGCGHACRFCAAGHLYRPPRIGRGDDFLAAAQGLAADGGRVGLVSAAVTDLDGLDGLALAVSQAGGSLGVSSVRADRLTPAVVQALAAGGHQTVALAPEAGSARLRRVINKHLSEDDLFRAVEMLVSGGVANLRLYFMVGLPGEQDDDVAALIDLARQVRQQVVTHSRPLGRLGRVTVSLNAFVPKPFTPFQWEPMAPLKLIEKRMKRVQSELKALSNLKVVSDVPKYARLQAVLARGDRRVGRLVSALAADSNPGRAMRAAGIDPEFYAHRRRDKGELLPWAHVDHGLSPDYLWSEAQRALQAKQSPVCAPTTCRRCGVCGGGNWGGEE